MGEENKLTFLQKSRNNWNGFRKFLWNGEKHEFLGRNGKSWGQIGIFYLIFYICLAGFWALMLFAFMQTVSNDNPTFNSLVGVPGLTLDPKFDVKIFEYNPDNPETFKAEVDRLTELWERFDPVNMMGSEFVDCDNDTSVEDGAMCRFDRETLGPCRPPNFGWDEGRPCFYVHINKVSKWIPENYDDVDDIPKEIQSVYEPDFVTIFCKNYKDKHPTYSNNTVYPSAGISFDYYPFVGGVNVTQRNAYVLPYVAVQFHLKLDDTKIKLQCQSFSGNIKPLGGLFDTDFESIVTYEILINRDL